MALRPLLSSRSLADGKTVSNLNSSSILDFIHCLTCLLIHSLISDVMNYEIAHCAVVAGRVSAFHSNQVSPRDVLFFFFYKKLRRLGAADRLMKSCRAPVFVVPCYLSFVISVLLLLLSSSERNRHTCRSIPLFEPVS